MSKVSVAILSFNRPAYLREALMSVLAQTMTPLEIVILDNGSDADVKEKIADLLGGIVEWRGWEPHSSVENFRRAFAFGRGDYVYLMHDDDRLMPRFLEEMSRELDQHPELVAVASNGDCIDHQGKSMGARLLHPHIGNRVFRNRAELAELYADWFLPFPTVVYVKKHLTKVRINEEYGKQWDAIFLCDLAEVGPISFLDRPLFEYRLHPQQDSVVFPEPQYRLKEDYILKAVTGTPSSRRVASVVARQRAKRGVERVGKSILAGEGGRSFIKKVAAEGKCNLHLWLLSYLMNPPHLAKVYLHRAGFR